MLMAHPRTLVSVQPHGHPLTYEPFFGLTEKPFSLNSDPRFFYHSPSHAATFENLLAGIRRREGLLVLTGEIGAGKTMLCRAVLRNLGRKTFSSFVPDPFASREDLLKMLLIDFGVMSIDELTTGPLRQASRTELAYLLSGFLESLEPLEAFVVVMIDEAQNMSLPLIEETRILADSFGSKGHLQIVFVGQPELHAKLKLPEMRQVDQRVCGYNRLAPLGRDAAAGYIQHRLHVAGLNRERELFSSDVCEIIHRRSGGVPRLINRICDRALHLAHLRQAASVDRESLETALIEVGSTTLAPTWASIISPEPQMMERPGASIAPPLPAAQPAVAAVTTPTDIADAPDEDENFSKLVDEWATQELAPAPRHLTRRQRPVTQPAARPAPRPSPARPVAARHAATPQFAWRDTLGQLRSETYLQRLTRVWAKRVAIAVVSIAALSAAVVGASLVSNRLSNVMSPPALPALPGRPALAVLNLVPPASPSVEPSPVTAAGDYVIAVGLFADRSRADRLVEQLMLAGLRATQRPSQLGSQRVQQVVLGPFANRSDAVADLTRLRLLGGHDDANVVGAPPEPTAP